ncbi:MAG: thiamine-binding protein [Flavobacteriales bacterium]|nr:thiamine-binding protein [Flavobacteriales bacterium]
MVVLIKASELKHEIGPLSTFVSGDAAKVFQLLESIYNHMNNKDCGFTMNVMLSNRCGCSLYKSL